MDAMQQIRAATHAVHAQLEKGLAALQPGAPRQALIDYLVGTYRWIAPINLTLWSEPWPALFIPEIRRMKQQWLATDLLSLGVKLPKLPDIRHADLVSTYPKKLGLAYVVEGSMLGTRVIDDKIRQRFGLQLRFLQGYGEATTTMWRTIAEEIEDVGSDPKKLETIIVAACATFVEAHHSLTGSGERPNAN